MALDVPDEKGDTNL